MKKLLFVCLIACAPNAEQRAKNAVDLAGYAKALDECRELGKTAKSYAVYEDCAKKADVKYGYDGGAP